MPNKPPMKMGHSPTEMSPYKMGHSPNEMGHSPNEMGHSPMENQNKGYAEQERKDLIQDTPIDTRASSIINAGIRSRMGGQPQMGHSPAEMDHDSPAKKTGDPETDQSKQLADIKSSVKSFGDKIGQKAKPDFKSSSTKDFLVTDPVVKKYDGYSSNKTLTGRQGTNTTSSGSTVFPGYSSKSVGTYEKGGKIYNKIRPGAQAKSLGDYANMANKDKKSNFETADQAQGFGRRLGTFKTIIPTEQDVDKVYGDNFSGKTKAVYGPEVQGFKSGGRAEQAFGKTRANKLGRA